MKEEQRPRDQQALLVQEELHGGWLAVELCVQREEVIMRSKSMQ